MANIKSKEQKKVDEAINIMNDIDAMEIKEALNIAGVSIQTLYNGLRSKLRKEGINITFSTFKNMLDNSSNQTFSALKRQKVIEVILSVVDVSELKAEYEAYKRDMRLKAKRIFSNVEDGKYKNVSKQYEIEGVLIHTSLDLDERCFNPISEFQRLIEDLDRKNKRG
jgi:transposase